MEGRRMKVFGVVMVLLLVLSFAATFSVSSPVSAGTQKWTQIQIPDTNDMQLAPLTDVGAIAVTPDGATLFAAVYNASGYAGNWSVFKSTDDGYTWKVSGNFRNVTLANSDNTEIVAIGVSPSWADDHRMYVATQANVYSSKDSGKTWASRGSDNDSDGNPMGAITCMSVATDENGDAIVAVGTDNSGGAADVYILGEAGWDAQRIQLGLKDDAYWAGTQSILAVAFSPNYGEDGVVFAIPTDGIHTYLCGESDITVNNWGSYIQNAKFYGKLAGASIAIPAEHACMAFPDDYNSAPCVFVGLVSGTNLGGNCLGDAFRVDLVSAIISTSSVTDLKVRGADTATNIYSIAVSGPSSSAFILVGLSELNAFGPSNTWMGPVHYSSNGGESWLQSYKPPSGMAGTFDAPIVVMAPDYATSGKAYCSNGYIIGSGANSVLFSGFFVSTTQGTTWNGRGLLDHTINSNLGDSISDIQPSPDYENDSTLFMVTRDAGYVAGGNFGLLWETKDGGKHWELINGMTLAMPLPGISITTIRIPATYPQDPEIFLTGSKTGGIAGAQAPNALIARSTDQGNLFASTLNAPFNSGVPLVITSWIVVDDKTLVVANGSNIYKTTDFGAHWKLPTQADIDTAAGETIIDMKRYKDTNTLLVSTDRGHMFLCQDWLTDFSFTEVKQSPCTPGDRAYVAFDTNFDTNNFVYAGITSAVSAHQGIWRADVNSDDPWDRIDTNYGYTCGNVSDISCDGNGILWAICPNTVNASRSVNPNEPLYDRVRFETVAGGAGLTSALTGNLETAPTQTYVFAVGGNVSAPAELWAYIDTLIKPTLISPADGTTAYGIIVEESPTAHVTLQWEAMPKAQWYDYQIAYDSGFGSLVVPTRTTEGSQGSEDLFLGEKFYWRVRVNGSPVLSQWSDAWSFTTPLGPSSAKPICSSPTQGLKDVSLTPTLQWSSAVSATNFELVVAANCDWSNAIVNLTGSSALGTETAYQITHNLSQGTNYCWKVRAINSNTATNSPWSDTGTFTTLTIPPVTTQGTPTWVWVVIALSAVLLVGVVVLIVRTRRPV